MAERVAGDRAVMARPLHRVAQRVVPLHQAHRLGEIVLADLAVLERALPERPLRLIAAAVAQHHRQRDLALAEIVAHALAERRRLARIVERIVDQLEGEAEIAAVGAQAPAASDFGRSAITAPTSAAAANSAAVLASITAR